MSAPEPQVRVEEMQAGCWQVRCDSCGLASLWTPNRDDAESGAETHRQNCTDLRLARLQARWDARAEVLRVLVAKWRAEVSYLRSQLADELERAMEGGRE